MWQGVAQADVPKPYIDGGVVEEPAPIDEEDDDLLTTRGPGVASATVMSMYLLAVTLSMPIVLF